LASASVAKFDPIDARRPRDVLELLLAGALDNAAAMFGDLGFQELAPVRIEAHERALFGHIDRTSPRGAEQRITTQIRGLRPA
jgi:hypothetical protein